MQPDRYTGSLESRPHSGERLSGSITQSHVLCQSVIGRGERRGGGRGEMERGSDMHALCFSIPVVVNICLCFFGTESLKTCSPRCQRQRFTLKLFRLEGAHLHSVLTFAHPFGAFNSRMRLANNNVARSPLTFCNSGKVK